MGCIIKKGVRVEFVTMDGNFSDPDPPLCVPVVSGGLHFLPDVFPQDILEDLAHRISGECIDKLEPFGQFI